MLGASCAMNFFTNRGITAAYAPLGSWRRPNTLKYRRPMYSVPYVRANTSAYSSSTYFVIAYGDSGRPITSSTLGRDAESP